MAKKYLWNYFTKEFPKEECNVMMESENYVFKSYKKDRVLTANPELTLAYFANLKPGRLQIFGKPINLLFMEDLVFKISAEVLESIFYKSTLDFN